GCERPYANFSAARLFLFCLIAPGARSRIDPDGALPKLRETWAYAARCSTRSIGGCYEIWYVLSGRRGFGGRPRQGPMGIGSCSLRQDDPGIARASDLRR